MAATEAMGVTLRAEFRDFEKALLKARNETDTKLAAIGRDFEKANAKVRDEARGMAGSFRGVGASLPGLSGGMGALGAAGAAGAIGVGALAVAFSGLQTSVAWAADLTDVADRIGVTVEALQELRYAADETGVPLDKLDGGLEALNASLGAFKTGIGAGRITPVFAALGLTQADLVNVENAAELLPILADRLSRVEDRAAQVQLAKKLGIESLLPLLRQGASGIEKMSTEARDLGLVLSNEVVGGLDEADRALEKNKQQIDANVRQMQASLAPFFVWASGELAKLSRAIVDLFSLMGAVENRADRTLANQEAGLTRKIDDAERRRARGVDYGRQSPVVQGWINEREQVRAERRRRQSERVAAPRAADRAPSIVPDVSPPPGVRSGGGRSGPVARSGPSPEDLTRQREMFDLSQQIELLRAQGRDEEARAASASLDTLELTQRYEQLGYENAAARAAEHVKALNAAEDAARRAADMRAVLVAHAETLLERERSRLETLEEEAAWEARIANLRGDPVAIDVAERELFIAQRVNDLLRERAGLIDEAQARQIAESEWGALDAAEREGALRDSVHGAFRDGLKAAITGDARGFVESLADHFTDRLATSLADTLTDIFMGARASDGGGGIGGIIGGIIGSFFKGLPGFKTGGSFKVGGSGGLDSQMVAFRATPGEMVDIRKPGQVNGGGSPLHFDLRGAVMTSDLLSQMQRMATQSGGMALGASRRIVPAEKARADRMKLGAR